MVERMIRLLVAMEIAMRMLSVDWYNTRGASRATSKTLGGLEQKNVGRTSCYHSCTSVKGGITPCAAKVAQEQM